MTVPPHLRALIRLKRAKVDFLLVGALALDHFLPEAGSAYSTGDCDVLLRPTPENLRRALSALSGMRYQFSANGEPLERPDSLTLRRIIEFHATLQAHHPTSVPIDLMLDAKGFSFEEWWSSRTSFLAGGVRINCASLEHILESKRLAGRKKDKVLLRLFRDASLGKG